jgi:tRNA A-37 threonylcarbamoyl transferase component Bud32
MSAVQANPEGRSIGGCTILQKLGEGGMGAAYKAHHERLDRPVVIKLMHPHLAENPDYLGSFIREARAAARLEHPNIVQVYDCGSEGPYHYIIMQFVEGETVDDFIAREKKVPQLKALQIVKAVLGGLGEAHRHAIVHRDVKPSNILLGNDGAIRLGDFGLAAPVVEAALESQDLIMGTPAYISPEQATGAAVDTRTDIYSLGATFFHMLSGQPPFPGANSTDIISRHVNNPAPDIRTLDAGVSNLCAEVIGRMMAKRPEDRYQSVAEVLTEILRPGIVMESALVFGERTLDLGLPKAQKPQKPPACAPARPAQPRPKAEAEAPVPTAPAEAAGAGRLAVSLLSWASAGALAYLSGLFRSVPLGVAAAALAAAGALTGRGWAPRALAALGAAGLLIAGALGMTPSGLLAAQEARAALPPAGFLLAAIGLWTLRGKTLWSSLALCLLLLSCAACFFAFPLPGPVSSVLRNPAAAGGMPLLLAGAALLAYGAAHALMQSDLSEGQRLPPAALLLAAASLASYAAGAAENTSAASSIEALRTPLKGWGTRFLAGQGLLPAGALTLLWGMILLSSRRKA